MNETKDLRTILHAFKDEQLAIGRRLDMKHEELMRSMRQQTQETHNLLEGKLRRATIDDYKGWLAGYLMAGGKPNHYYDYPMKRSIIDNFRVALSDFKIGPLYGTNSIEIIVPEDVKFLGGDRGHINLYFMDGFKNVGEWIPVFSDIDF